MERFLSNPLVLWLVFFFVSWPFFLALQWIWWGLLWLLAREGALITVVVLGPMTVFLLCALRARLRAWRAACP
jgi:hypothetical protein